MGNPTTSEVTLEGSDINYVTPHDIPSGNGNNVLQGNPLSTTYGVPLAEPIGPNGSSGTTENYNSGDITDSNTSFDINTSQKQNGQTFGISSSAVSGTQGTLVTSSFGSSTSNLPSKYPQPTSSQNLPSTISPTTQPIDGFKSNSFSNAISNSSPQNNNFNNDNFPSQFQVITSLDPIPETSNGQVQPQNQPDLRSSSGLSDTATPATNNLSPENPSQFYNPSGPTVQSSVAETTYDSSLDTYGSPSAEPLSAQTNNGFSNQQSADTSYGAPLAEPLEDGYGAPKAAPIDVSSYGAPLAQPVSQSSYGAPQAAPLSRYQSKQNWPPPPPPPPQAASLSPFKSFSLGRSKRLQRYRHNFRNRFKRKFPAFLFRG